MKIFDTKNGHWKRLPSLGSILAMLLFFTYLYLFLWADSDQLQGMAQYWFNPKWATDDSTQQTFPFLRALYPGLFDNDFVAKMMMNYIPPLHYWLGFSITLLTKDPVMTGHWLMLIQLSLTLVFLFGAVYYLAGSPAAFFAITWFLHTKQVVQRMPGGLPRGWSTVILSAYFFLIVKKSHRGILALLLIGSLIHQPSTLIVSAAYGLYLLWQVIWPSSRLHFKKHFFVFLAFCPLLLVITLWSASKPSEFGNMVTYEQALNKPEFSSKLPKGRFAFVPFKSIKAEVSANAFHAFANTRAFPHFKSIWCQPFYPVTILLSLVLVGATLRRKVVIPIWLWAFAVAAAVIYIASRILAFRLFVPDRYLQSPFALFFIVAFTVAIWRLFTESNLSKGIEYKYSRSTMSLRQELLGVVALSLLGLFVYSGSGSGLHPPTNFNYPRDSRGRVFEWVRKHTPQNSLIAGDPIFIDPVQLFGERAGYITAETAHPFYDKYWVEALRRLEISVKAHYAETVSDFVAFLEAEKVDFFIFDRKKFVMGDKVKYRYFNPLYYLVESLTSGRSLDSYVYSQLEKMDKDEARTFLVFRDDRALLVDIKALKDYLNVR